jgi:hypothetical protein
MLKKRLWDANPRASFILGYMVENQPLKIHVAYLTVTTMFTYTCGITTQAYPLVT